MLHSKQLKRDTWIVGSTLIRSSLRSFNKEGEPVLFLEDEAHLYLSPYGFLLMHSRLKAATPTRF